MGTSPMLWTPATKRILGASPKRPTASASRVTARRSIASVFATEIPVVQDVGAPTAGTSNSMGWNSQLPSADAHRVNAYRSIANAGSRRRPARKSASASHAKTTS